MKSRLVKQILMLRMTADEIGDDRSLVAIVAEFERKAMDLLGELGASIVAKGHNRNIREEE